MHWHLYTFAIFSFEMKFFRSISILIRLLLLFLLGWWFSLLLSVSFFQPVLGQLWEWIQVLRENASLYASTFSFFFKLTYLNTCTLGGAILGGESKGKGLDEEQRSTSWALSCRTALSNELFVIILLFSRNKFPASVFSVSRIILEMLFLLASQMAHFKSSPLVKCQDREHYINSRHVQCCAPFLLNKDRS